MSKRLTMYTLAGVLLVLVGAMLLWTSSTTRADTAPTTMMVLGDREAQVDEETTKPSNDYCLLCHSRPGRVWELPSGEALSLTIDEQVLAESVHGESNPQGPLVCADCHPDHRFPHPPQTSQNIREFKLERYGACRTCHEEQYTYTQDSVHGVALREGRLEAAVCVDCHGGHDIQPPDEPRQLISLTCGNCHGAIFEEYRTSIHGAALLDESNPDVPTCIDCHGVHNISDPLAAAFRTRSPELCARCHADSELMAKYGISDNVFQSYLSDFHGTTVALFEQEDPDVATNKAVCYDCHGVHDIQAVDSETSHVVRENLLATCQQCHPDATADFPDSWVGHHAPTLDSHPLLYAVNLFYDILIPGVVGVFLLLIATDLIYRIRRRLGKRQGA